jgi:ABC-type nickel/cobalt efflux system permease component RcnA
MASRPLRPACLRTLVVALAILAGVTLGTAAPVMAHPLGNFSVNQYSALRVGAAAVEVLYVLDMAEIPTFQELREHGLLPDPADAAVTRHAARKAALVAEGLQLEIDGRRVPLAVRSTQVAFPPGLADLPTMRLRVELAGVISAGADARRELRYRMDTLAGRVGWKEIVAAPGADARVLRASVPARDRSAELTSYAGDLLDSPPQVTEATVAFAAADERVATAPLRAPVAPPREPVSPSRPATAPRTMTAVPPVSPRADSALGPRAATASALVTPAGPAPSTMPDPAPAAPGPRPRHSALTDLIAVEQIGVSAALLALAIAAALGALHALEPGHGKTVVAAYLVGSRGTAAHALWLGLIVTASHTAGVYLLGALALWASRYMVPDQLYPWLGLLSGLLIAGLGFRLFLQRYAGQVAGHHHEHAHDHHHTDGHDGRDHHAHHHGDHHHHPEGPVTAGQLLALGLAGGIVPCPGALVVLLAAVALNRVGFGLLLIAAFSAGLAAVLIAIGLAVVYSARVMSRWTGSGPLLTRWLPLTSSAVMAVLGLGLAAQALVAAGIVQVHL